MLRKLSVTGSYAKQKIFFFLFCCSGLLQFIIGRKKPGYVCIVDSNEALRRFPRESGIVHGAAFRSVFGCSKESVEGLVGEGFAVMGGGGEVQFVFI